MQLGKKSKNTDIFERVKGDLGHEAEEAPLAPVAAPAAAAERAASRVSSTLDRDAIHVLINEAISAKLSRDGALESLSVSGDLQLRVSDPSLSRIKLNLSATPTHGAQFRTHPNVDKNVFNSSQAIQLSQITKGFPLNNSVGVLRWRASPRADDTSALPISFTVWVNKGSDGNSTLTVEYELTGGDTLKDVTVVIPYSSAEPQVSSFDAVYEVSGDSLEWSIGTVSEENASGSFEFEAQTDDENEFFPMQVRFSKSLPFVEVDVSCRRIMSEKRVKTEQLTHSRFNLLSWWMRVKRFRSPRTSDRWPTSSSLSRVCCRCFEQSQKGATVVCRPGVSIIIFRTRIRVMYGKQPSCPTPFIMNTVVHGQRQWVLELSFFFFR